MIEIVNQVLKYYLTYKKTPSLDLIEISDQKFLQNKASLFVTLYKNGEIVGSSGNVVEWNNSVATELILNTIFALQDVRAKKVVLGDIPNLKIRIDVLKRAQLKDPLTQLPGLNPVNSWLLAIKHDNQKLSVILPNISPTLTTWESLCRTLINKLDEPIAKDGSISPEEFLNKNYHLYEITSHRVTNY